VLRQYSLRLLPRHHALDLQAAVLELPALAPESKM
jgi:hypothetical protein